LTVLCHPSEASEPQFIAYDGSRLVVEWASPAGCPFEEEDGGNKDDDKKDDKKEEDKSPNHESVGSGLGWFFLACVVHLSFKASPGSSFTLITVYSYVWLPTLGWALITITRPMELVAQI
jgi:hypothetical protein